ncbi:MAG: hypothetical protein B7Z37_02945 [Verrucomicrobia bacterium 12-59-8]|nr:MAG: hypothetical protein B7Z37_02945 [Verrucomicrobia bacterium 12-59-8]
MDDIKPNPYMGEAISIAFGKFWPREGDIPASISVWYRDPESGILTTIGWKEGEGEVGLFEKLLNCKEVFEKHNAAVKRIEARRVESFETRTRKPKPTGTTPNISLEDLLK